MPPAHSRVAIIGDRTGPPIDDDEDYALPVWGGVVPVIQTLGQPVPDGRVLEGIAAPQLRR